MSTPATLATATSVSPAVSGSVAASPATLRTPVGPAPTPRLASLDTFRGFIMFWLIGGEALVAAIQGLGHNWLIDTIVGQLHHTPWVGLRFYDCIWPSFMLMVGLAIPFAFAKRSQTQTYRQQLGHALWRAVVLFLLGSIRESNSLHSPYWIELSSALQPIAISYLAAFLLVRSSVRVQAAVAGGIWLGYALLLAFVPGLGIAAGSYGYNQNLVHAIDLKFLGAHYAIWPPAVEGWGTILSTVPVLSTTILGLCLGGMLRGSQPPKQKAMIIAAVGLGGLALGYGLSPFIPIEMKIWTTTYGLASAGWACLMFALFYSIIDVRGWRRWTLFFAVIGMNALAAYLTDVFTKIPELVDIFIKPTAAALGKREPLLHAVVLIAVEWSILYWLYRRRLVLTP